MASALHAAYVAYCFTTDDDGPLHFLQWIDKMAREADLHDYRLATALYQAGMESQAKSLLEAMGIN